MSKITLIVQARLGSLRFPRKVLAIIEDKMMIEHVIERVKLTKNVEQIVLCTTENSEDEILLDISKKLGIFGFAGEENDVLGRFFHCAKKFNAGPIIRITGDCPLIDPHLIDKMIKFFISNNFDYMSNTIFPTFPDGFDVEIFSFEALKKCFTKAKMNSDREHVTPFMKNHPESFRIYNFENNTNLSDFRLTVDEEKDLELIKKIFFEMYPKKKFYLDEIIELFSRKPYLKEINKSYKRNQGYFESLKRDKNKLK